MDVAGWPIRIGCNGVTCTPCGALILRNLHRRLDTKLGLLGDAVRVHLTNCPKYPLDPTTPRSAP